MSNERPNYSRILTAEAIRAFSDMLPPIEQQEIRTSRVALEIMRSQFSGTSSPLATFAGIPVVIDSLLPEGFAAWVGETLPFDLADPFKQNPPIVIFDLRPKP